MLKATKYPALLGLSALFLALATSASAQIATIDLKRVFDSYWKTKQADMNLDKLGGEYSGKFKEMEEELKQARDAYTKSAASANDQAFSVEVREQRKKDAEAKFLEAREIEQSMTQYQRQAQTRLAEEGRRIREKILEEIKEIVQLKAKNAGYALVIDTAAETINKTPVVLFSNGQHDLTDSVLEHVNLSAPQGFWDKVKEFENRKEKTP